MVMVSFWEVPLLASNALLTTLHLLPEIVLQTIDHFEISCLGAPFSFTFSKPNTKFNSDLAPMQFLGFSNHENGALRQEISK
jgi:hypothetical protein